MAFVSYLSRDQIPVEHHELGHSRELGKASVKD
jgi:hypothetical protein